MNASRLAIFVGSIASGFNLEQVVTDPGKAKAVVLRHLAEGKLAEAIEVKVPSSRGKRYQDHEHGECFVAMTSGVTNGIEVFGPFPDDDIAANQFGEDERPEDGEWEILNFTV